MNFSNNISFGFYDDNIYVKAVNISKNVYKQLLSWKWKIKQNSFPNLIIFTDEIIPVNKLKQKIAKLVLSKNI